MAEDGEDEIDPAIAEAMGFSGFGMQPGKKRKLNADMAFVDSSKVASEKQSSGKDAATVYSSNRDNAVPGGHHIDARGDGLNDQQGKPDAATAVVDTALPSNIDGNDEQSLRALANGVRNKNGDMVYFLPNFLEDPWRNLEPR